MADTTALTAGAAAVLMLAIGAAATGMVGPSRTDLGAGLTLAQSGPQANARDLPPGDPDIAPALPPQPGDRGVTSGRVEWQVDANRNVVATPRPVENQPVLPPDPAQPPPPAPVVVETQPAVKNPPVKPQPLPTPVPPPVTKDPVTTAPTKPPATQPTVTATAVPNRTATPGSKAVTPRR